MPGSSNGLGLRSFAVSLALHAFLGFGLTARARALAHDAPRAEPRTSAAWSGETFEVDELVGTAAKQAPAEAADPAEPASPAPPVVRETSDAALIRPVSDKRPGATVVKSATATAPPGAAESAQPAATGVGAFGAAGLPPGVRSLPSAFCRAIPPATRADPAWQTLPVGSVGSIQIVIEIDDSGKIVSAEPDPAKHRLQAAAPHLKRLVERTVLLLGAGTFALSAKTGAGVEKLLLEVDLSQRAPTEDSEPTHMTSQGFEPPSTTRPGRAHFTLGSGRHFEARLTIVGR